MSVGIKIHRIDQRLVQQGLGGRQITPFKRHQPQPNLGAVAVVAKGRSLVQQGQRPVQATLRLVDLPLFE